MKGILIGLIFGVLLTAGFSSCCDGYDSVTARYDCSLYVGLKIYSAQDSLVDSILNLENQKSIPLNYPVFSCIADSGYCSYSLPLDPNRPSSSFAIFYDNRPSDTVVVNHQFEIAWEKCRGDYFELKSKSLSYTTFQNPNLKTRYPCLTIAVHL